MVYPFPAAKVRQKMQNLPFRTGETWLTDGQLVLLDVMFEGFRISFPLLKSDHFSEQWNVNYSHDFSDEELLCNLHWLCEHGVIEMNMEENQSLFEITRAGGDLWSKERRPLWDRYCTARWKEGYTGRVFMSVIATSPGIRDDYLRLHQMESVGCRRASISDYGVIPWRRFPQLYVAVTRFDEQRRLCPEAYARLKSDCSWWTNTSNMQRFLPKIT